MDKYYISISKESINNKQSFLNQDEIINTQKSKVILNNNNPSPRTMKKEKSRENFMKYQWAWTL